MKSLWEEHIKRKVCSTPAENGIPNAPPNNVMLNPTDLLVIPVQFDSC